MQVVPWKGWILVAQEEDHSNGQRKPGPYYVAWHDIFSRKKDAIDFAKKNNWNPGYRAVRGKIAAA